MQKLPDKRPPTG